MKTLELATLDELLAAVPPAAAASQLLFVADVGATNTRVSFVPLPLRDAPLVFFKTRAASVPDVVAVFAQVGERAGTSITSRIVAASVAMPGPVSDNGATAVMANFAAADTEGRTMRVSKLPPSVCPPGRTRLLNDLHACAAGIAALHHLGAFPSTFKRMWGPATAGSGSGNGNGSSAIITNDADARLGKGSVVVLAPGTGLGAALLHYDADADAFIVIPLEFGHTHIATFRHTSLLSALVKNLDRGNFPPEFDDICSGRGLEFIFAASSEPTSHGVACDAPALAGANGSGGAAPLKIDHRRFAAHDITLRARVGDVEARTAFALKYGMLMNLASQLAMGFVPHTIVIAGDNAVRHAFFLGNTTHAAQLRDEFLSHTMERMGFMSRVQVARQAVEMNLNLVGAAFEASRMRSRAAPSSKL
jgi:glucokinase